MSNLHQKSVDARYGNFTVPADDDLIGKSLRLYGEWAQLEIETFAHFIRPGLTIVDVGSFIGTHARAFSSMVGAEGLVYAFEPNPEAFNFLHANIAAGKLKNIRGFNVGLGRISAFYECKFSETEGNMGSASLTRKIDSNHGIKVIKLDEAGIELPVHFIKIDVEGMELDVLIGAEKIIQRSAPVIFTEVNTLEGSSSVFIWGRENDYRCFGLITKAFNPMNFNKSEYNIYGLAKECGFLLIHKTTVGKYEDTIKELCLTEITAIDGIALLLLHKPQYPYEVLANFASADLDLNYPSPLAREIFSAMNNYDGQITNFLDFTKFISNGLQKKRGEIPIEKIRAEKLSNKLDRGHDFSINKDSVLINYSSSDLQKKDLALHRDEGMIALPVQDVLELYDKAPVQIIVPVYLGMSETISCIENLINSRSTNRTPFQVTVIDDCSPEPELAAWLRDGAQRLGFQLLHNEINLGFVQTVNRGMELSNTNDIVLLNSDTITAGDWLDRLHRCAYREAKIGTVTPFTNNGEICSYPKFCADNSISDVEEVRRLHTTFSHVNDGKHTDIPTGVGFCMYIRRELLQAIGLFDAGTFGRGYGEENDFCRRGVEKGWRNVLACDVFVAHVGAVSFDKTSNPAKERAQKLLNDLHPTYHRIVHQFILKDPLLPYRLRVDLERLRLSPLPVVVFFSHNRGGGTKKHIDELAELLADSANCLLIEPLEGSTVTLRWLRKDEAFFIQIDINEKYDHLLAILHAIGVSRIHIHHTMGLPTRLFGLPADLGVPFDFTVHDYYTACPQITLTRENNRYCGELGVVDCHSCLAKNPAPGGVSIEVWRGHNAYLLNCASRVIAPSLDVMQRMRRYFPEAPIVYLPHPEQLQLAEAKNLPPYKGNGAVLRVAVLGAISQIKGADVLEKCAVDAMKRKLPIQFKLIGYAYRSLLNYPMANLEMHGSYDNNNLRELLRFYDIDLIWFPALWPETYSYTLSAALAEGNAVLAPDLGSFAERLAGRGNAWVYDWRTQPDQINDMLFSLWSSGPKNQTLRRPEELAPKGKGEGLLKAEEFLIRYIEPLDIVRKESGEAPIWDELFSVDELGYRLSPTKGFRYKLVDALYLFRSIPMLRLLARVIPTHFQRRIKNKILRF